MDGKNHLEKNPIQKDEKTVKKQTEIAACEQKTTSEKANFRPSTVFTLYFKIRAKKVHAAKSLVFSLHFLFRRDQNHYSNLTSKIMKMCEQILKRQRPNTIQILSIVISGQVLAYNSKDFYWLNKNRPRPEYEWIMKTISKNQTRKQKTENQWNAASDNKKSLTRNTNLILTKN